MIPRFQLPAFFARAGRLFPQWPHAAGLALALNAAIAARLLPADSLAPLEGRSFLVVVSDAGTRAAFTYGGGSFRPLLNFRSEPDLTFRANLSAFLRLLAREEDPDTLFFNRELSIEGDTELGLVVKNMLEAIELPKLPKFS
jgi:O2-independent ubiquinone biosynthesis accessory factor UbiT